MTAIRGIKQEIGHLKNSMENPHGDIKTVMHPSEDTRLHWAREYLDKTKQTYVEAGGPYTLSKSEQKTADFDTNINAVLLQSFKSTIK